MSLATPPRFTLTAHNSGHLALASEQGDTAHVFILETDIIRVLVLPGGRLNQPRTFAIAPGADDVAQDGRDRFDLAGFTQPEFALEADTECLRIETTAIRLTVRLAGFSCSWALRSRIEWLPAASDRPTQAYNFGWWDERVYQYLLRDHPLFAEAADSDLLIADPKGEPSWVQFWDGIGAYLGFTQPKTLAWWKAKVKETLLDYGIAATWNDNNEFEIWSAKARAHGFGQPRSARECKPLQSLLMMRASRDAQKEHAPNKRPFLVSRSGGVGMHRYAQTWSGDNSTSWETLGII
jgi:Glycosyl hydrolases family 31